MKSAIITAVLVVVSLVGFTMHKQYEQDQANQAQVSQRLAMHNAAWGN